MSAEQSVKKVKRRLTQDPNQIILRLKPCHKNALG